MNKIELGTIKTTHRTKQGVDQIMKLYNLTQRRTIMEQVQNGVENYNMRVTDVLDMYDISPPVYYTWVRSTKKKQSTFKCNQFENGKTKRTFKITIEGNLTQTEIMNILSSVTSKL